MVCPESGSGTSHRDPAATPSLFYIVGKTKVREGFKEYVYYKSGNVSFGTSSKCYHPSGIGWFKCKIDVPKVITYPVNKELARR